MNMIKEHNYRTWTPPGRCFTLLTKFIISECCGSGLGVSAAPLGCPHQDRWCHYASNGLRVSQVCTCFITWTRILMCPYTIKAFCFSPLTLASACRPRGSPAGIRGTCCGAARWRPATGGWACGWAAEASRGPSLCSAAAWVGCQAGSWCWLPSESEVEGGQNASDGAMGVGTGAQSPRPGRTLRQGCRHSADRRIKGGPGPGGCGTCAGCTWTGLWGFGKAGTRSTGWPLAGTPECFPCLIQRWATG